MKREYREVIFKDTTTGKMFLTRSTVETTETIRWDDGKEYPLYKLDVSSDSHPAFTGKRRPSSTVGRIEAFRKRYEKR